MWITPEEIMAGDEPTVEEIMAVQYASFILFKLTGEMYPGFTTVTDWYQNTTTEKYPYISALNYVSSSLAHRDIPLMVRQFAPSNPQYLELKSTPVVDVFSIVLPGGKTLSSDDVYIYNRSLVARKDGGCWNFDQGVLATYTYGALPPAAARIAAIMLAKSIVSAVADGSAECQIGDRVFSTVQSVNANGISYTMIDPQQFLKERRTGITAVDLFIKSVNPNGATSKPKVYIPDRPSGLRRL